jgi:glutamine amidotransferase
VYNALTLLDARPVEINSPEKLRQVSGLVLPGVGTFANAMQSLRRVGLAQPLTELLAEGKTPYLGICLGMQILADRGFEFGEHSGLGIIPGEVRRLEVPANLRLPHIGWNDINIRRDRSLLDGSLTGTDFYFVHSYHFVPVHDEHLLASCDYGKPFAAAVGKGCVFGVQFHPEKSQEAGRVVLRRFVKLISQC